MIAGDPPFGMQPDGTPWPVPAQVLEDPGRGALWGLAAGDALGRAAGGGEALGAAEQACAVAESLMACGMYEADDVAWRVGPLPRGVASLVRTVPIALFYAGEAERRVEVIADAWRAAGDDATTTLAAVALAGVIARAAWQHDATTLDLMVTAVEDLEAAAAWLLARATEPAAIDASDEVVRAELVLAVDGPRSLDEGLVTAQRVVRVALWHLHHETPLAQALAETVAAGLGPAAAAVVGAVLGAALGEARLPSALTAAARTLGPADAPTIERLSGFVDSGPFARG